MLQHNIFQIELDEPISDEQADEILMFVDTDADDHLSKKGKVICQSSLYVCICQMRIQDLVKAALEDFFRDLPTVYSARVWV